MDDPLQAWRQLLIHFDNDIAVLTLWQHRGNPMDPVEFEAERIPAFMDMVGLELCADQMGHVVGQHGNEQMSFNPLIFAAPI